MQILVAFAAEGSAASLKRNQSTTSIARGIS
jgi:hypothetical protein